MNSDDGERWTTGPTFSSLVPENHVSAKESKLKKFTKETFPSLFEHLYYYSNKPVLLVTVRATEVLLFITNEDPSLFSSLVPSSYHRVGKQIKLLRSPSITVMPAVAADNRDSITSSVDRTEQNLKPKKKICCACPETKKARDECVVLNGEEACKSFIEAHKKCLRSEGFNV